MPILIAINIFYKEYFEHTCFKKIRVVFASSPPYHTVIFCIRLRKAVSANVIGSQMEEKQSMHRLKEMTPAFL